MPAARKPSRAAARAPGAPPAVYALVGAESFLQQHALHRILESLGADVQRTEIEGAVAADAADVFDELRSYAMFGGARAVVIRDADDFISRHRESLEAFLASIGPAGLGGNVLVLRCSSLPKNQRVYKLIDKAGQIIPCDAPPQRQLPAWITERGREAHGLKVAPDAARMLADLIGPNLGALDNELAKLALQSPDGRVTPGLIGDDVAFRREQEMWRMTDALSSGGPEAALRVWRQLTATDPAAEFRAVTWLAMWLERALGALKLSRRGLNAFAIARELRIWPADQAEPLLRTARALGETRLTRATHRLAELDHRTKTGLGEAARAVEEFIVSTAA